MSLTGRPLLVLLATLAILIPLLLALTLPRRPRGPSSPGSRLIAMVVAQLLAVAAVGAWANNTFGFYDSWSDLLGGSQKGSLHAKANGCSRSRAGRGASSR
jgi:hypothetical protein